MKNLLILLTSLVVIPTSTNLISNIKQIKTENNNLTLINKLSNLKDNPTSQWDSVRDDFNNKVNDPNHQLYKGDLTQPQKDFLINQSSKQDQTFTANNIMNGEGLNNYLSNSNADFKTYFDNRSKSSSSDLDQILFEYCGQNKVDLGLDGANTYQDAINILQQKISAQFTQSNIKITLLDSNLGNKTLFDDSSAVTIANFVNNNLFINVNLQNNQDKVIHEKIQLTNIQLSQNSATETQWLSDAIASYFDVSNPQDLNLRLQDTRKTAFDKILNKIKLRFANYEQQVKITLTNPNAASQNFFNPDIINDVFNQAAWIGVNIASTAINKNYQLYLNFKLNDLEMNEIVNFLFLTESVINSQNLGLTTDDTYQGVVDKLNKRLFNLDTTKNYQAVLVDASQANTTLETQYRPDQENLIYHVNINFQMKDNNQFINIGSSNLSLTNVTLGKNAQAVKDKYQQFQKLMDELNNISTILNDFSIAAAFAAAAMWASAWYFGISIASAVALTAASSILGIASSTLTVMVSTSQNKLTSFWGLANAVAQINILAFSICFGIYGLVDSMVAELTATSWAGVGFIITCLAAFPAIIATVKLLQKNFE